jgi:glycosyltransferase involved in cell wall biosynthesis
MRVLHVTLRFAHGGRRTAITSLIDGLRDLGVVSGLCCLEEIGCPPEELAQFGDRVEDLRRQRLFDWRGFKRLRNLCREESIDVIHTHDAASQITAAIARLGMWHVHVLMSFHRSLPFESAMLSDRLRNAIAATQCGAIITASRERRAHFLAENMIPSRKVIHIPIGIDLSRFHPDAATRAAVRKELGFGPEVILVGSIGHSGKEKGIDVAIRGFQALSTRRLRGPIALVVFGEGPLQGELEELAAQGGPGPIYFAGFRDDIHRYMTGLDVLLHAPRMEAFGLVVIESMATGIPVVASRVGGLPELVRDGITGFLAESDQPESFAAALERLVNDRDLLESMGKEARRVALAEYGRDLYAQRHLQLYEDLLANRSVRQPGNRSITP